jgi:gentisate 1,2-dioxygenase
VAKVDTAHRTATNPSTSQSSASKAEGSSFVAELEAANLHPLWDRFKTLTPVRPQAKDPPLIWRWTDVAPLAERAVGEVAIDDVERRALILVNPAFAGQTVTTNNLIAAFTVLDPGDRARPHRHTFSAIRFATNADGAATIVNGRRCAMRAGDLILTPPMCWHGHINESNHRIVWFDAANIPLLRTLDANFFEPGDTGDQDFWRVDAGDERLWAEPGLIGADVPGNHAHSPKYHYSGEATRRLLAAVPRGADGAHSVRYINPCTGGAVMPALDCHAVRLARSEPTRPKRMTCNMICLVVAGEGHSSIGEHSFAWSQHDVFSIPHWTWASHEALGGDADLFVVSDKSAFERLELLREELQ